MKRFNSPIQLLTVAFALTLSANLSMAVAAEVPRMTKEQLQTRIDKGDVVIIDVRTGRDWNSSEFKIQGAQREDTKDVASWAGKYEKDQTLVFYCA